MITFENVTGMYKTTNIYPGGQYIFEEDRPDNLSQIRMYYENKNNHIKLYKTRESFFIKFDSFVSAELDEKVSETFSTYPSTFEITGAKEVSLLNVSCKTSHDGCYTTYIYYYLISVLGKDDARYFYTIPVGSCLSRCSFEGMISHDYLPHDERNLTVKELIDDDIWIVSYDFKPQIDDSAFFMRIYFSENKEAEISKFRSKDIIFCLKNMIFLKGGMIDKSTGIFYSNDGNYAESSIWDKAYEVIPFLRNRKYGSEEYWIGYKNNDSSPFELKELFINADFNQYIPCVIKGFVWDKHREQELYSVQRNDEDTFLFCYDLMLPHIIKCPISVLNGNNKFLKKCRSKFIYFIYYKPSDDRDFSYFISERCPIILTSCYTGAKFRQSKDTTIIIRNASQFEGMKLNELGDVIITVDDNRVLKNIITGYEFEKIYGVEKSVYFDKKCDDTFFPVIIYGALVLTTYDNRFALYFENQILKEFDSIDSIGLLGVYRVQIKDALETKMYYSCFEKEIIPEEKFLQDVISNSSNF